MSRTGPRDLCHTQLPDCVALIDDLGSAVRGVWGTTRFVAVGCVVLPRVGSAGMGSITAQMVGVHARRDDGADSCHMA
jgi:hypothetical protein